MKGQNGSSKREKEGAYHDVYYGMAGGVFGSTLLDATERYFVGSFMKNASTGREALNIVKEIPRLCSIHDIRPVLRTVEQYRVLHGRHNHDGKPRENKLTGVHHGVFYGEGLQLFYICDLRL